VKYDISLAISIEELELAIISSFLMSVFALAEMRPSYSFSASEPIPLFHSLLRLACSSPRSTNRVPAEDFRFVRPS